MPTGRGRLEIGCPSCGGSFWHESSANTPNSAIVAKEPAADLFATTRPCLDELCHLLKTHRDLRGRFVEAERLREFLGRPLTLLVTGPFNGGKSTLVNCLLGQSLMPTDVVPTSAVPIVVTYGAARRYVARYDSGKSYVIPDVAFREVSREDSAEGATLRKGLTQIEVSLPSELLRHVSIVDSPGLHSLHGEHTQRTKAAVADVDVVVWVTSCAQVGSAAEVRDLKNIRARQRTLIVANQIDLLDEEDNRAELLRQIGIRLERPSDSVLPLSARYAFEAILSNDRRGMASTGWQDFRERLVGALLPLKVAERVANIQCDLLAVIKGAESSLSASLQELRNREAKLASDLKAVSVAESRIAELRDGLQSWRAADRVGAKSVAVSRTQVDWLSRPVRQSLDRIDTTYIAPRCNALLVPASAVWSIRMQKLEEERSVLKADGGLLISFAEEVEEAQRNQLEVEDTLAARRVAFDGTFALMRGLSFRRRRQLENDEDRARTEKAALVERVGQAQYRVQTWLNRVSANTDGLKALTAEAVRTLGEAELQAASAVAEASKTAAASQAFASAQAWAQEAWVHFDGGLRTNLLLAAVTDGASAKSVYDAIAMAIS